MTLRSAEREILMERRIFREQFLAALDAFVPGSAEPREAPKLTVAPRAR